MQFVRLGIIGQDSFVILNSLPNHIDFRGYQYVGRGNGQPLNMSVFKHRP